ncbi:synaptosomal-associated protein 29 [Strongylocentrotus purpuratus]|uniref:Synaptosomal-associated protein 29 n=1 Tax=Strongylocentrotus purpuratus TaxID=7668 RepID=A0A7M7P8S5_STRPU|nr:synaptosomal-associated protein 29 [Strongylocentrotus purpuratus]|eukprot:XP_782713.2 PREDICTED: synaptosomal-associated protein 29 [Strongylocentrotus purpuratus]
MSGKNPFFDEGTAGSGGAGSSWNDWEDVGKESTDYDSKNDYGFDFQSKQMEIDRRKQNMLSSTQRSMGLMYEAEQVGNETAAELLHQGEQLQRVDTKLDKMDKDLDISKRHITSMKSIFGGIVNYFNKPKPDQQEQAAPPRGPSKLKTHMERSEAEEEMRRANTDHPALKLRGVGASETNAGGWGPSSTAGFGAEDDGGVGSTSNVLQSPGMKDFDNQLNSNLDDITSGIGRLKGLAMGLNDELDKQNDDIDRITGKVGRVDVKLGQTDKEVKKILRR